MADEMDTVDALCADLPGTDVYFGQDMQKLQNAHLNSGYKDGITDGQESTLQQGFNAGFSQAALQYGMTSKFRGCISALLIHSSMKEKFANYKDGNSKLESYLAELKELEAKEPDIDRKNIVRIHESQERQKELDSCIDVSNTDIDNTTSKIDSMKLDNGGFTNEDGFPAASVQENCSFTESTGSQHEVSEMEKSRNSNKDGLVENSFSIDSFHYDDSGNQKLTLPFSSNAEWEKIESVLNQLDVSKQLVNKLKASLNIKYDNN